MKAKTGERYVIVRVLINRFCLRFARNEKDTRHQARYDECLDHRLPRSAHHALDPTIDEDRECDGDTSSEENR